MYLKIIYKYIRTLGSSLEQQTDNSLINEQK